MEQDHFSKGVPSSHVRFKGQAGGLASKGKGVQQGWTSILGEKRMCLQEREYGEKRMRVQETEYA